MLRWPRLRLGSTRRRSRRRLGTRMSTRGSRLSMRGSRFEYKGEQVE